MWPSIALALSTTTLLELTSNGACKERPKLLLSSKAAQGARQNALYRFYSGQDALTFAHDSLFPSVPERDFQDLSGIAHAPHSTR
jgi:hypothetical protein